MKLLLALLMAMAVSACVGQTTATTITQDIQYVCGPDPVGTFETKGIGGTCIHGKCMSSYCWELAQWGKDALSDPSPPVKPSCTYLDSLHTKVSCDGKEFALRDDHEMDALPGNDNGTVFYKTAAPEVPDVEAVKETFKPSLVQFAGEKVTSCGGGNPLADTVVGDGPVYCQRTTCADKSRILLHDEQTPPKFYCHKVQSGNAK